MANELLAIAYEGIAPRKSERLRGCATQLRFAWQDERYRLKYAWFCRVRLCPMCSWRRSLKTGGQIRAVMEAIRLKEDRPKAYIVLTLTIRNVPGETLSDAIGQMLEGFNRMMKLKEVKKAVHGYFRGLEVTHNVDPFSDSYDTYHPHVHCILCVNASYFTGRDYIKQERWVQLWRQSARLNYDPSVDVRRVKGDTAAAVAEVAKYTVKSKDYIIPDDWDLTVDAVAVLDAALHNRRLVGMGGIIKDYHKKLHLDDLDTGDLVHVDEDPLEPDAVDDEKYVCFAWYSGYRQYGRVD